MKSNYLKWVEKRVRYYAAQRGHKVEEHNGKVYIFDKDNKRPWIYPNWEEAFEFPQ